MKMTGPAVLLALGLTITASFADANQTGSAVSSRERCAVNRINHERDDRDLKSLSLRSDLTTIARDWSRRMAGAGGISHNANLGHQVKGSWSSLGENVGAGHGSAALHEAFMGSRSHRANILRPEFNQMGVGIFVDTDGMIFITEVFARRTGGSEPSVTCATTLAYTGTRSGMQGQRRQVAARLSDASGAIRGKVVTFRVAGLSARAITGADGVARAWILVSGRPGSHVVTAHFAGSSVHSSDGVRSTLQIRWPHSFMDRIGHATVYVSPSSREFLVVASGERAVIRRAPRMETYPLATGETIISLSHQEGAITYDGLFELGSGDFAMAYRAQTGYRVLRNS